MPVRRLAPMPAFLALVPVPARNIAAIPPGAP